MMSPKSASEVDLQVGDIVEFTHEDDHKLGVVFGRVGSTKITLYNDSGATVRCKIEDVVASYGRIESPTRESARDALLDLNSRAEAIRDGLDLRAIWQAASDAGPLEASELGRELGEDPAAQLAIREALRGDRTYFRRRKDGLWEARTPEQVESARREEVRNDQAAELRDEFVGLVVSALTDPEKRAGALRALDAPQLHELLTELQHLAAFDEYDDRRGLQELLHAIDTEAHMTIPGTTRLKAFNLMVMLGIWSTHENLTLIRYGVREDFPEDVVERAEEIFDDYWRPEPWREDLRGWWTLTIDDATTRDIDDALSVRPTMEGGWTVAVHVADPSAYVPKDDLVDREARRRGSSIYPPTGTIPMFPSKLSEDVMSLLPKRDRAAISLIVDLSPELEIESWRFVPSAVNVNSRMTYEYADQLITSNSLSHEAETLAALQFIADELFFARKEAGAVHIQLPETRIKVEFDASGEPKVDVRALSDTTSRQLIAEFMVLYNSLAAEFLNREGVPAIFRSQNAPDYTNDADKLPEGPAREFARLKSMRRSDIGTSPARHYGMAVPMYVQATSPIRRYSDLVMQRQMTAALRGEDPPYTRDEVYAVVLDVEKAIHEGSVIQRESTEYWLTWYLSTLPPETRHDAVVLDYKDARQSLGTVLLPRFGLRTQMKFRNPPALGEHFEVQIEKADPRREKLLLRQA